jgi:hypothetical protein
VPVIFLSEKGDADVCSIGVSLNYTKYMAYDHFVYLSIPGIMGQKLWPGQREGPKAVGLSRATRFVSRLVATDFLDWTGSEREAD